jgi:hypothetical protein
MFTGNRSTLLLSSLAALLLCTSGCPDPQGRLEDYNARVVDASTGRVDAMPLPMIPDVNGSYLMAIAPGFAPNKLLQFTGTATYNSSTGTLDVVITPLRTADRTEASTGPITLTQATVNNAGEFSIVNANEVLIPGEANSVTGLDAHVDRLRVDGVIKCTDPSCTATNRFCGFASGFVRDDGADLGNPPSTFSAIRITPGTTGSALPPPEAACP